MRNVPMLAYESQHALGSLCGAPLDNSTGNTSTPTKRHTKTLGRRTGTLLVMRLDMQVLVMFARLNQVGMR